MEEESKCECLFCSLKARRVLDVGRGKFLSYLCGC